MKLGFIGLGVMGFPMAGHLSRAGHDVTVYNRTGLKSERWQREYAGSVATSPVGAAEGAEFVIACVGNDDDLRTVTMGPGGALGVMKPNTVFVDHTTTSAAVAREVWQAAQSERIGFLDAPVSGGQAGAEKGSLTIMVGGEPEEFEKARSVLDTYADSVTLMGQAGAGQLTKMCNQICVAGLLQGLAEGLSFAMRADLDIRQVVEVLSRGAASSWQLTNRGRTMAQDRFDFGFAVDWMRKDLGIVLEEARRNGALLPVTALVDQFYAELQAQGGGRLDTSSLIRLLRPLQDTT